VALRLRNVNSQLAVRCDKRVNCDIYSGDSMRYNSSEEIETVAKLWAEGYSASIIGDRMGRTRSTIIGIVHRHLAPTERERRGNRKATRKSGRPKKAEAGSVNLRNLPTETGSLPTQGQPLPFVVEPIPDISESDILPAERVKLVDLTPAQCHWPLGGDPRDDPDFGFCGRPRFTGIKGHPQFKKSSCYCLKHYKKSMGQKYLTQFEKALGGRAPM